MNQSKLIITLLIIVLVLLVLQILLNKKKKEHFYSTSNVLKKPKSTSNLTKNINDFYNTEYNINSNNNENKDIDLANTYDFVEYSRNSDKLLDMFKSLDEAEKKCSELEDYQYQKEERNNMRENDRTFKELQEQDKKINELKEIVKYLTIEKKRRDKINNRCRNNNQVKLNKQYDIVRKLNKDGLVDNNSINLDLNISDSAFLKGLKKNNNNNNNNKNNKCSSKGSEYINLDTKDIGKCYGCDSEKLKKQEPYILKDFS